MAKKIVVANWKMNPETVTDAGKLYSATVRLSRKLKKTEVIVAAPFLYISRFTPNGKRLSLGAQDAFWGSVGAATGEISARMLKKIGVTSVICGHSERRALGETDAMVSKKVLAVLKESLTPILCIGERERDHQGSYFSFITEEIKNSLAEISRRDISKIIIAYEPIWAIGKSADDAMNAQKLHEIVIFIHKTLTALFGRQLAEKVRIIYGGSVEAGNADDLIRNGNVSGFLVGHASLDLKNFGEILTAADRA